MDEISINDAMTEWIACHPDLITFIKLEDAYSYDIEIPVQFKLRRATIHHKSFVQISEGFHKRVFAQKPKKTSPQKIKTITVGNSSQTAEIVLPPILDYKLAFVQYKIEKLQEKQFDIYAENVAELLTFYGKDLIPLNIIFSFDFDSFEKFSFQKSNKLISLINYEQMLENRNMQILTSISKINKTMQRQMITRIIDGISSIYNDVLSYFPLSPLDSEFDKFLFSRFFPFKIEYSTLLKDFSLDDPETTVTNILSLAYKMITYYQLEESPSDSILFLLIFRCLFNDLYKEGKLPFFINDFKEKDYSNLEPINHEPINREPINHDLNMSANDEGSLQNENFEIHEREIECKNRNNYKIDEQKEEPIYQNNGNENKNLKQNEKQSKNEQSVKNKYEMFDFMQTLTFRHLEPPEDSSLASEYNLDSVVSATISNDLRFRKAISALHSIQFSTNPLDALNCVRNCLRALESSASDFFPGLPPECMIAFDKVFALLLLAVTGSGVSELEVYADFTTTCLPERLLSLPFQFALTKLGAVKKHVRALMNEKKIR
ncbi:hypothetical protein TRFO_22429 [Tritrichomonas foetus]|uniref:VPS9 domain-containing protein n=1 Tax=Tritrichomonas foetus TaxID=1144522 RepID=A0A1J4KGZ8_9EUKA|nr:hypothetical protein TRFO_22429 [Tritrichomonas foetus]|eukprot:OHT08918.1 hypothetical protein TRFO_22429 [Tritrichomonas foetus]